MIKNFLRRIYNFLSPAIVIGGLGDLFTIWQGASPKERVILIVSFAPMGICLVGLLLSIASFVLFVLPSFVLRFLGWLLLTAIFAAGGKYCYLRMTKRPEETPFTSGAGDDAYMDVPFTDLSGGKGAPKR